ncbi:DUF6082 family protein [Actinomadura formosensis]|uniref:DUF6082 family protein n=1 Tax=Actinomadura formosensis TaxID=60706 RepID=UPI000832ECC5|nr:DUF6082 family protein [Actinomadura formosensis]
MPPTRPGHGTERTLGLTFTTLAVLALLGIAATLDLQAPDTKIAREEARRSAITGLLKMAMDDPDLDKAWGPSRKAKPAKPGGIVSALDPPALPCDP